MKKVLVTGGSGFIASYFIPKLADHGVELINFDFVAPEQQTEKCFFVQGDIRDREALRKAMEGCDAVLHLAAAHHDFGISEQTFFEVNEGGAQNLCDAMNEFGVRELCFFSTVAVYGTAPLPHSEKTLPAPVSPYGRSKLAAEQVFQRWAEEEGNRRCLVIRPTVTFGPRNFANVYTLIRQIDRGRFFPVGKGANIKSLSYVENIVEATLYLWLENPTQWSGFDVFNWIDKPDMSSMEITNAVYQALGKRLPSFHVPYYLALAGALPFDFIIALTGKNLPISGARIHKLYAAQTKFEADKILATGFQPSIPLTEGLAKMVAWYQDEGKHQKAQWHIPSP